MTYKPSYLNSNNDVDKCIEEANAREANVIEESDLARITTSWIHRIIHHTGAVLQNRKDKDFFPKIT